MSEREGLNFKTLKAVSVAAILPRKCLHRREVQVEWNVEGKLFGYLKPKKISFGLRC